VNKRHGTAIMPAITSQQTVSDKSGKTRALILENRQVLSAFIADNSSIQQQACHDNAGCQLKECGNNK
tara:strand:- start:280 stop:483 length:204 start_codon:yes stop_codon:yes gene_type:complete